jgi:hypothetical protein
MSCAIKKREKQMIRDPLKFFAVEYSMTLNSVHRRSLRKVIENNQSNLRKGYSSDFVPIGLFPSREEADRFIEQFTHTLGEQAQIEFHSRDWQHVADIVEKLLEHVFINHDTFTVATKINLVKAEKS